jgi:hypothetical protein
MLAEGTIPSIDILGIHIDVVDSVVLEAETPELKVLIGLIRRSDSDRIGRKLFLPCLHLFEERDGLMLATRVQPTEKSKTVLNPVVDRVVYQPVA